ncbi:MAG: hypothetical protein JW722_03330 [Demequinaceae bacterium]|nr:hypothetical protein [Demequinaceae bacterium]
MNTPSLAPETRFGTADRWKVAILITAFSIAFAEVTIANEPFGLIGPWVMPLMAIIYGGHALLLASWVYRTNRRFTMAALWSAGVIFGLYEFFLTGVLWGVGNEEALIGPGGISWWGVLVLACFWHSILAFILPLLIVEQLAVERPRILGLAPAWIRRTPSWLRWTLLVLAAVFPGAFVTERWPFWFVWIGLPGTAVALTLLVRYLRPQAKVTSLADALPTTPALKWIGVVFAACFVVFGASITGENLISTHQMVIAVALYGIPVGLLLANLRATADPETVHLRWTQSSKRGLVTYIVIACVVAGVSGLLPGVAETIKVYFMIIPVWFAGGLAGLLALIVGIRQALKAIRAAGAHPS